MHRSRAFKTRSPWNRKLIWISDSNYKFVNWTNSIYCGYNWLFINNKNWKTRNNNIFYPQINSRVEDILGKKKVIKKYIGGVKRRKWHIYVKNNYYTLYKTRIKKIINKIKKWKYGGSNTQSSIVTSSITVQKVMGNKLVGKKVNKKIIKLINKKNTLLCLKQISNK